MAPTAFQRKRTNTTVLDSRHLKVKQQDISLTRNHCITISIQKIRISIQKDTADFIKSHKLKGHDHFDHAHTNIIETPFSFSQFIPACKKSVYSICSFLKQSILESRKQTGHTHFQPYPTKKIRQTSNFCEYASTSIRLCHAEFRKGF